MVVRPTRSQSPSSRRTSRRRPTHAVGRQPVLSLEARVLPAALAGLALPGHDLGLAGIATAPGQVVYLDFAGARGVTYNGPVRVGPFDVPAFSAAPAGLAGREPAVIAATTAAVAAEFAPLGVGVTAQRPAAGPYSTVYVGGSGGRFTAYGSFLGLAEEIDPGNANRSDNALVFSDAITPSPRTVAGEAAALGHVISHEVGHLLGGRHDDGDAPGPLGAVAYAQGASNPVHQYLSRQGYELFAKQFGPSEMDRYAGQVTTYDGGSNQLFTEGAYDEDVVGENPFGENTDSNHPSIRHFWYHDANFQRAQGQGMPFTFTTGFYDSSPDRSIKYFSGGYGASTDSPWQPPVGHGIVWAYRQGEDTHDTASIGQAYYWLGHVAHLLQDITLPAHAHADPHVEDPWLGIHLDPDPFHDWIDGLPFSPNPLTSGNIFRLSNFTDTTPQRWTLYGVGGNDGSRLRSIKTIPSAAAVGGVGVDVGPLYQLFLENAGLADDYDTKGYFGQVDRGSRGFHTEMEFDRFGLPTGNLIEVADYRDFDRNELDQEGQVLIPQAIVSTAELIRYFYGTVDTAAPTVDLTGFCSTNSATPQVVSDPRIQLNAAATDQATGDSGVGKDLFKFEYRDVTPGSASGDWTELIQGGFGTHFTDGSAFGGSFKGRHGASSVSVFNGQAGHTYVFRASTEDGAGKRGYSKEYAVKVGTPDEAAKGCLCTSIESGSPVDIPLGDVHPGDVVSVTAELDTNDPNENGEGEPLIVQSSGGFSVTVDTYSDRRALSFTVTQDGETLSAYIDGQDGDDSGEVCVTVNAGPGEFDQGGKDALSTLSNDLNAQLTRVLAAASGAESAAGAKGSVAFHSDGPGSLFAEVTLPDGGGPALAALAAAGFRLDAAFLGRQANALTRMTFASTAADFATVPQPDVNFLTLEPVSPGADPGVVVAFNALFADEAQVVAVADALNATLDRAHGAAAAGDGAAHARLLAAAGVYLRQLAGLLAAQPVLRANLQSTLTAAGFSQPVGSGDAYDFEGAVARDGLPEPTIQALLQAGSDGPTADSVAALALAQNTDTVAQDLPGALTDPNFLAALQQAEQALRASAGAGVPNLVAVGADAGGGPLVRVLDAATGAERFALYAYDPSFTGGVRVALGDVTGDGVPDLITAAGPGGGPHVRIFDGVTGGLVREFFAYDTGFTAGVFVAAGDVNGDGIADIVTGAGAGGGPHVKVFDGATGAELQSFFAYDGSYTGGVNVAAGDVNGDGKADIVTGTGAGGGPHVKAFSGADGTELMSFFAYDAGFTGGVFVAAGDVNGDGKADIITGAGAGGGPDVRVFSGADGTELGGLFAFDPSFTGGVRVGVADANGDGKAELVLGAGPGGGPQVRVLDLGAAADVLNLYALDPAFVGGVFVG